MMNKTINNERGFVLVVSLLMLVVLMIIGIAATNTTDIELQIAGNDKAQKMNFYVAESGWQRGAQWLENLASPPDRAAGATNSETVFSLNPDAEVTSRTIPTTIVVNDKGSSGVAGSSGKYRRFHYQIVSTANQEQVIEVAVAKTFKVGY